LWYDVVNSPSLSQEQKNSMMRRLVTRIGKDGVLRVISKQTRSEAPQAGGEKTVRSIEKQEVR